MPYGYNSRKLVRKLGSSFAGTRQRIRRGGGLATQPGGFTSGVLAAKVREHLPSTPETYQPRHAAYDRKKLRGKNLVEKLGKSRRYQAPGDGLRTLVALGLLRNKVLKPVLRQRNS